MVRRSRLSLLGLPIENLTRILLICAWMCLIVSTFFYFGSLLAVVYISSYGYPVKWNFVVYVVNSGVLYLLNVISNALLISTKPSASTRSSSMRSRDIESLGSRLTGMNGSQSICHQEVQTNEVRITPPPPYEYLSDGTSEVLYENISYGASEVQPVTNIRIQEHDSVDIIELLKKILSAVNNSRTISSEQPPQREVEVSEYVGSRVQEREQTTSEMDTYTQIPPEVLDHLSDPTAFIRALAIYKSENRLKQCLEKGKKVQEKNKTCLAKQEALRRQNFKGRQGENLENSTTNINSNNLVSSLDVSYNSTSRNLKKPGASLVVQKNAISGNQQISDQGNFDRPAVASRNLGLSNPMRNFNSVDNLTVSVKSRTPTRAKSNFSLPIQENRTLPRIKEISQQDLYPKVPSHCTTSNKMGGSMKDLDSTSSPNSRQNLTPQCPRVSNQNHSLPIQESSTLPRTKVSKQHSSCPNGPSHCTTSNKIGGSMKDLGSTSSRNSQQNLTPQCARVSKQNLSLPMQESSTLPRTNELSQQDRSYPQVHSHCTTSNKIRGSVKELGSTSSSNTQSNLIPQSQRICKQYHSSTSSKDSQQELIVKCPKISKNLSLTSSFELNLDSQQEFTEMDNCAKLSKDLSLTSSRDSHLDLYSTNPTILRDITSVNSIGIPMKGYPSNRSEYISDSEKSQENIYFGQLEHKQACSNSNEPLRKTRSIHALHQHQCTPCKAGQQSTTDSASEPNLEGKSVHKFSTESVDRDQMTPTEWFSAWNRSLNKISHNHDSPLMGARL